MFGGHNGVIKEHMIWTCDPEYNIIIEINLFGINVISSVRFVFQFWVKFSNRIKRKCFFFSLLDIFRPKKSLNNCEKTMKLFPVEACNSHNLVKAELRNERMTTTT